MSKSEEAAFEVVPSNQALTLHTPGLDSSLKRQLERGIKRRNHAAVKDEADGMPAVTVSHRIPQHPLSKKSKADQKRVLNEAVAPGPFQQQRIDRAAAAAKVAAARPGQADSHSDDEDMVGKGSKLHAVGGPRKGLDAAALRRQLLAMPAEQSEQPHGRRKRKRGKGAAAAS